MLINERTNQVVASRVQLALSRRERRKGLLGRDRLDADEALLLSPCFSVHTVSMRFPIDVAFVDRAGRVVRLVHRLQPWRVAASVRAHRVIELPAGRLQACGVALGDRLYLHVHGAQRHRGTETTRPDLCDLRGSVVRGGSGQRC
jgi:uncharacterized membrane protein (UPF0127 family)